MRSIQEKMEKDVLALIFREYPDMLIQINRACITSRNFTGVGFFTNYYGSNMLYEDDMVISGVGGDLNNSIEVGFVFFLGKDGVHALECYTYGDPFPDQIESYEVFVREKSVH